MTWYTPTITVVAASEPVTLAEAKAQCRVDGDDDNDKLNALIAAARGHVEGYTGTPLVSRTVTVKCDGFCDFTAFPVVPLTSVSSVSYIDGAGATQTLSTTVYEVRSDGLIASLALTADQTWPTIQTGSRVTVTAIVGYSAVPDAIKHAILLLIAHWFDQRSPVSEKPMSEVPHAVEALLTNHRSFSF